MSTGTTGTGHAMEVVGIASQAARMLHPIRMRILESLREPDSASGLARRLGMPRQKLNYHLRELERARLVELVEERRKGNCTERILRATARSYVIAPEALGALGASASDPESVGDRFSSSYLLAVAARLIQDVASLRVRADAAGKKVATLTLQSEIRFASAEARHAFAEDLANALAGLAAKYHDETAPGGRRFRLIAGVHPAVAAAGGRGKPTGRKGEER